MTKLSRYPVQKKTLNLFLDDFWTAVSSLETKREVQSFITDILTPTEQRMFAKRFQIAMMLVLGYQYEAISRRVKVSEGTIAAVNNIIRDGDTALKRAAKKITGMKANRVNRLDNQTWPNRYSTDIVDLTIGNVLRSAKKIKKKKSLDR